MIPVPSMFSHAMQKAVKLGRIRPKARPMCPKFASYFDPSVLATLPDTVDYSAKAMAAIKHMYLNDTYGCCVISGKAHQEGVWSGNDNAALVLATDAEILAAYRIWNPGHQDNGCNISDVLDYMRSHGLIFGGAPRKIDGYLSVNWTNQTLAKAAIYLFGSLTLGVNLPNAWLNTNDGDLWEPTNSGIVGGHDICAVGYNATGVVIATWGGLRTITWAAFTDTRWVDECYVQLAPDWYGSDSIAPSGLNIEKLKADLELIGGGNLPPLEPDPVPVDPPVPVPPGPVVPPVPPVPPEPVVEYAVTGVAQGVISVPTTWGRHVNVSVSLPVTGTATPKNHFRTPAAARIRWLGLIADIKQLVADCQPIVDKVEELGKLWQVPYEDVLNILRELGISV